MPKPDTVRLLHNIDQATMKSRMSDAGKSLRESTTLEVRWFCFSFKLRISFFHTSSYDVTLWPQVQKLILNQIHVVFDKEHTVLIQNIFTLISVVFSSHTAKSGGVLLLVV